MVPNWVPWDHHRTPQAVRLKKNIFLSKLVHLGLFTTNFGDKIIKKNNFQNWSQKRSHRGPMGPLQGPPTGPLGVQMSFWWQKIFKCIPPTRIWTRNRINQGKLNYVIPPLLFQRSVRWFFTCSLAKVQYMYVHRYKQAIQDKMRPTIQRLSKYDYRVS